MCIVTNGGNRSDTISENAMEEKKSCRPPNYLPTPEEIRAACEKFQEDWSAKEREYRRVGVDRVAWSVPGSQRDGVPCVRRSPQSPSPSGNS